MFYPMAMERSLMSISPVKRTLMSISPVDGRYSSQTLDLVCFFSEYALIKYRISIEINYFTFLYRLNLPEFRQVTEKDLKKIRGIMETFDLDDACAVKEIEETTCHDVKAVEYFIRFRMKELGCDAMSHYIHYGLTSQDINHPALSLILKDFQKYYTEKCLTLLESLMQLKEKSATTIMMARTHGQPASPTCLGKELMVFYERLWKQLVHFQEMEMSTKFGGSVGNLNAHVLTYPEIAWQNEMDRFIQELGLVRQQYTTQVEHYDTMAAYFDAMKRINTILIDLCRDMWMYISMEYFIQTSTQEEIGSSTMPHKVNPIQFEKAAGNLMLANALLEFLSRKLPISRLQRDLTDSTVTRNIGVACSHTIIGFKALVAGLNQLKVNADKIRKDLENHWVIVAEGIQTFLRKEGVQDGYERLKAFCRGHPRISQGDMEQFIKTLPVNQEVKTRLMKITPMNYTGYIET